MLSPLPREPRVYPWTSSEILEHSWSNLRGLFWWNRGVKRSLNNDLDLIPARALQAGGRQFDPGHVHQLSFCSSTYLHCIFSCTILSLYTLWHSGMESSTRKAEAKESDSYPQ